MGQQMEKEQTKPHRQSRPGAGFASLSPEQRREVAQMGGRKSQALGVAFHWTSEQAREAGRKGGLKSRCRKGEAE